MTISKLYHYTSINNLALILRSRSIRFGRLDNVNDPTEGVSADFHPLSMYFFISCWTNNEEENLALWNMYTPKMRGVRIELPLPIFNSHKIGKIETALFTEDEFVDENKGICLMGGENIPLEIKYTDDPSELCPKIQTKIENYDGLHLTLLGSCKRNIWSIENEYRYRLIIFPIDPKVKSQHFADRYSGMIQKKIPPSIDGYFIKIKDDSFKHMKLMISPKTKPGDLEIINALVEKYNPDAEVFESKLKGLIR